MAGRDICGERELELAEPAPRPPLADLGADGSGERHHHRDKITRIVGGVMTLEVMRQKRRRAAGGERSGHVVFRPGRCGPAGSETINAA